MDKIIKNGNKILTHSGKLVDPFDFKPEDVCIEDIAYALSNIVRFGGHSDMSIIGYEFPYTVAQHCINVSRFVFSDKYKLEALLHDASEAYIGDIPTPIKRSLGFISDSGEVQTFKDLENKILSVIFKTLEVQYDETSKEIIKGVDVAMLNTEAKKSLPGYSPDFFKGSPIDAFELRSYNSKDTYHEFLRCYNTYRKYNE